jgi:hypothetical protein
MIVSDNGTELTSNAVLVWCGEIGVEWHYIAPGKRMQRITRPWSAMPGKPLLARRPVPFGRYEEVGRRKRPFNS